MNLTAGPGFSQLWQGADKDIDGLGIEDGAGEPPDALD